MKLQTQFEYITDLIKQAKQRAFKSVNTEIIDLYWRIGEYLHKQVENESWGKSVIKQLSEYLKNKQPNIKGFSAQNLWRMKQYYEEYKDLPKLSTLSREISWSHNMAIVAAAKTNRLVRT